MLEVINLHKKYGEKQALKGINFKVEAGEIFGFLGPNGAGKTTTIKILTGQIRPSSGEAKVMNMDATHEKNNLQPYMGFVPEKTNLYERLTVQQNLDLFCRLYQVENSIDDYLKEIDLLDEKKSSVKTLSKGMKQRVLLIRALLHSPKVLLLDEPTAGLDPVSADTMHKILRKINQNGTTILLTSHNMEEVDKLCHRVAFIHEGLIKEIGTPASLKLKYSNDQVKVWIKNNDVLEEKTLKLSGTDSAELISDWILNGKIQAIHSCEPSLADIFVKVTGRDLI